MGGRVKRAFYELASRPGFIAILLVRKLIKCSFNSENGQKQFLSYCLHVSLYVSSVVVIGE